MHYRSWNNSFLKKKLICNLKQRRDAQPWLILWFLSDRLWQTWRTATDAQEILANSRGLKMATLLAIFWDRLSSLMCFSIYLSSYKKRNLFPRVTSYRHLFNFITALCTAPRQISFEPTLINTTVCTCLIPKLKSNGRCGADQRSFFHLCTVLKECLWWTYVLGSTPHGTHT